MHDLLQPVHAVLSVGQHVLVDCLDALVVVLQGMFNLVGGVLGILQAPGLGVVNGAGRRLVLMVWGRGRVVRSCVSHCMVDWSSVDNGMSHCMVDGSNMVLHDGLVMGSAMVGNAVGGMVHCGNMGSVVRNWSSMDNWGSLVVDERGDCCLVNWSLLCGVGWKGGREGGKEWKVDLRGIQECSDGTQGHLHGRQAQDHRQGRGRGCSRRFLHGELERRPQPRLLHGWWRRQTPKPGNESTIITEQVKWPKTQKSASCLRVTIVGTITIASMCAARNSQCAIKLRREHVHRRGS